jgi:hypothetical protein
MAPPYRSATVREQRRLRPVFVALLESVIEAVYAQSTATGAGHGVQLVTVRQDLAQAHDRWG